MYQQILTILGSSQAIAAAVVAFLLLLIKALTSLGRALEFHDKYFVEKQHKRLMILRASVSGDDPFTDYLDEAIRLEAFRIAFGVRTSPLKAAVLMKIFSLGYWNQKQILRISKYLIVLPENLLPAIRISLFDKVEAWYGLSACIAFMVMGVTLWIAIAASSAPHGFLIGLVPCIGMVFVGVLFATDYRNYKFAQRMQKFLLEHPDTFRPQSE